MKKQPEPEGKGDPVHLSLIKDIEDRVIEGTEKYGEPLTTFNGRRGLQDLYEELLDACFYIKQVLMEEETPNSPYDEWRKGFKFKPFRHKETILAEASRLVHEDRGKQYGHPIFDLTRTADIATACLRSKLRPGIRLEAEDIAKLQVGTKLSRETFMPKRDNRVDGAGYLEVLDVIIQWREENDGKDPRDCYE